MAARLNPPDAKDSLELELALPGETTPLVVEQPRLPRMEMGFVGHAWLHARRRYTLADMAPFDLLTTR